MRIGQYIDTTGQVSWGRVRQGGVERLAGDPFTGKVTPTGQPLSPQRVLPPMPIEVRRSLQGHFQGFRGRGDVWCIGKNYAEHAAEFDGDVPDRPVVFMKPASSIIADGEAIELPKSQYDGPECDYEAELAVIMGTGPDGAFAKDVPVERALDYILGYTCANDVSARNWQKQRGGGQWVRGKSFDTFCPLGPTLLTARPMHDGDDDYLADPQTLAICCNVSGETLQSDHTSHMVFPVAQLVSFLSIDTTLAPGTVILTGTPSGVGMVRKPPRFLMPGDVVEITLEKIGTLRNAVR
jgi:2-keto-4-pentenoate hydratase/2-oxohepta-3-ene-1,7-dioic acid hydratase in catechol pathway